MAYDKSVPFCFTKNGIYYFERRVPSDLRKHYEASKIAYSLRTRSALVAASRSSRAAQQLDEYWYHLRIKDGDLPGKHRLRMTGMSPATQINAIIISDCMSVKLSEAVAIYLKLRGQNRSTTFQRGAERSCGYVIDVCGDKDLLAYTKSDATSFRDAIIERGLTRSSITRIFGTVRSIINFTANEVGVTMNNPFAGVYYDRQKGVQGRSPLPINAIRSVQQNCLKTDGDLRWLVALLSDNFAISYVFHKGTKESRMKFSMFPLLIASVAMALSVGNSFAATVSNQSVATLVDQIEHGGGCRKSSPPGKCCHAGSKPLHCH